MSKSTKLPLSVLGMLMSSSLYAHHSQVFFDMSQCESRTGTIHSFEYQYPHSWLWVTVTDEQGEEQVWGLEAAAPAQMTEIDQRWSRDVVSHGDQVSVQFSPMKDGRTGGSLATLTLADGTTLRAATPACNKQLGPPENF